MISGEVKRARLMGALIASMVAATQRRADRDVLRRFGWSTDDQESQRYAQPEGQQTVPWPETTDVHTVAGVISGAHPPAAK